jgi:hypothetical protein
VTYRQEIEDAIRELKEFIGTHEARPHRVECLEDALKTLTYAARDAARWANRMMLLERRIRAAQNIFDGATKVSVEPADPESRSLPVLLRYDEARSLIQETSGKTGSLTDRAKRARDDIAQAVADHPVTRVRIKDNQEG